MRNPRIFTISPECHIDLEAIICVQQKVYEHKPKKSKDPVQYEYWIEVKTYGGDINTEVDESIFDDTYISLLDAWRKYLDDDWLGEKDDDSGDWDDEDDYDYDDSDDPDDDDADDEDDADDDEIAPEHRAWLEEKARQEAAAMLLESEKSAQSKEGSDVDPSYDGEIDEFLKEKEELYEERYSGSNDRYSDDDDGGNIVICNVG